MHRSRHPKPAIVTAIAIALAASLALAGCLADGTPRDGAGQGDAAGAGAGDDTMPRPDTGVARVAIESEGCREFLVLFPVPVAQARLFVPDTYALVGEATGQAQALAGLKECDTTSLDGVDVGPSSTSDVGVQVEAPDGGDELHYYQAWWTTDNPAFAAVLQAQGWRGEHTPDDVLTLDLAQGLAGEASFAVPWEAEGGYAGTGTVALPPVPLDTLAVGWHDGPHGPLTVRKTLRATTQGAGAGTITAEPGSLMARLIGGVEAQGPAMAARYDMTGSVGPER